MRQQLAEHGPRPQVERHLESQVELILRVVWPLAGEHEALRIRSDGVDFDLGEWLVIVETRVHDHLRGQHQGRVRDTPARGGVKAACSLPGEATFRTWRGSQRAVGRRGVKEYRAPEALALIAADREHVPLVCPSCGTRSIVRAPRRRGGKGGSGAGTGAGAGGAAPLAPERITLTCQSCGRHASYIERGPTAPRDDTMDPHSVRL